MGLDGVLEEFGEGGEVFGDEGFGELGDRFKGVSSFLGWFEEGAFFDGDFIGGSEGGLVAVDPAGVFSGGGDGFDGVGVDVEAVDGGLGRFSVFGVAEVADDVDEVADEGGGVEIGRREGFFGVAVDLEGCVGVVDEDVVVDAEVGVVAVFVFAGDLDDPTVGEEGDGLAEAVGTPDGVLGTAGVAVVFEKTAGGVGGATSADHFFPERFVHAFGV